MQKWIVSFCTVVLLFYCTYWGLAFSLSAVVTIHNIAFYFQWTRLPSWSLSSWSHYVLAAVLSSTWDEAPVRASPPPFLPRPHTAAVCLINLLVCLPSSYWVCPAQQSALELTPRRVHWPSARLLLLGSLYCHIMLNGPYKCLVKWLPRQICL